MDTKRSDTLARLLKAGLNSAATIDSKTGPVFDDEVGARIGLASPPLQRYRAVQFRTRVWQRCSQKCVWSTA